MALKKDESNLAGPDNLGKSGTDQFPSYQDEDGLLAKGKDSRPQPKDEPAPAAVELDHGDESPVAKAEREAMKNDPPSPTPVQHLPENQDPSVK